MAYIRPPDCASQSMVPDEPPDFRQASPTGAIEVGISLAHRRGSSAPHGVLDR